MRPAERAADRTYTIHVCPECGEQITESDYDPEHWGHYHDPPADWPEVEDPWFDAVEVTVVLVKEASGDASG